MSRYGTFDVLLDYSCSDALEIITAGMKDKNMLLTTIAYMFQQIQNNYTGTYDEFVNSIYEPQIATKKMTFDDAQAIGERAMNKILKV